MGPARLLVPLALLACDPPAAPAPAPPDPPPAPASAATAALAPAPASAPASASAPAPRAPSPPPLDLPAAALALSASLSASTETPARHFTVTPVPPSFLLATPSPTLAPSPLHALALARLETSLTALFHDRFDPSHAPAEPITIYVFPTRSSYDAFCRSHFHEPCETPFGVYRHETREIVVNAEPGLGTLNHELVHPLVRSTFPEAPDWLNECLGSYMEEPRFPAPGEITGAKNWRLPRLRAALATPAGRALARVDALFGMSNEDFHDLAHDRALEPLRYSAARYLCMWLDTRGELWTFMHVWADGYPDDPTGEKAFRWVHETTPAEANDAWVAWVKAL